MAVWKLLLFEGLILQVRLLGLSRLGQSVSLASYLCFAPGSGLGAHFWLCLFWVETPIALSLSCIFLCFLVLPNGMHMCCNPSHHPETSFVWFYLSLQTLCHAPLFSKTPWKSCLSLFLSLPFHLVSSSSQPIRFVASSLHWNYSVTLVAISSGQNSALLVWVVSSVWHNWPFFPSSTRHVLCLLSKSFQHCARTFLAFLAGVPWSPFHWPLECPGISSPTLLF